MDGEPSNERAVREIATNPVLRAEAERVLPVLADNAKRPAGAGGVGRVIGKRMALFPVNLPEEAMAEWWSDYFDALADLPESALEAGMRAHIKAGGQFMPKPGELRQLALTTENRAVRALERARAAIEWQPPRQFDPVAAPQITPRIIRDEPTAEDKARVRQMFADYSSRVEAQKKPAENPFKVKANVDERGLTAEMRALLEQQRSEA